MLTLGQPAIIKGAWLREIEKPDERRLMDVSIKTFKRFKNYSNRYCDADCADDVLNELIDTAEKHKTDCL